MSDGYMNKAGFECSRAEYEAEQEAPLTDLAAELVKALEAILGGYTGYTRAAQIREFAGKALERYKASRAALASSPQPKGTRPLTEPEVEKLIDDFAFEAGKSAIGVLENVREGTPDHAILKEGFNRTHEAFRAALSAPRPLVAEPPPFERSSADWRRLTGLWRYGVAVCPPTCTDFYNWLGVLDAAIDERTSRSPE